MNKCTQAGAKRPWKCSKVTLTCSRRYAKRWRNGIQLPDCHCTSTQYHDGFASQVKRWPVNPLDIIIKRIKSLPADCIVADFGCGEAALSAAVPQTTHSFDLVAANSRITVADSANVPLGDSSVDVAVFCLSLMGTNYFDFVMEARRVLRRGGLLFVAEVTSRFDTQDEDTEEAAEAASEQGLHPEVAKGIKGVKGGHRAGLLTFLQALHEVGFVSIGSASDKNTHFIMAQFKLRDDSKPPSALLKAFSPPPTKGKAGGAKRPRAASPAAGAQGSGQAPPKKQTTAPPPLKACIYKRR